jgi:hypothetical protein
MSMNGFNPGAMTDQELLDKLTQLQARLGVANRWASGAADQLNTMVQMCSEVLTERFERKMFESRFGSAEGGEKTLTLGDETVEAEKNIGDKAPVRVESSLRMRKSKRPVSNND